MPRQRAARHPAAVLDPDLLQDRYQLQDVIGRGKMAIVYRALDTTLDRVVAVKLLRPELCREPRFVDQFLAMELRVAGLFHPHLVTVFDVGAQNDGCFVVMEYVTGGSLREAMLTPAGLPFVDAMRIAAEVSDAVEALHRAGLIHGDIKPENVLLGADGSAKLNDVGVAHLAASTGGAVALDVNASTPYVSPKQIEHGRADERSDVYGLGQLLYEMLAGRPAFPPDSRAGAATARLLADPLPPSHTAPWIGASLDDLVLRALQRDPRLRYSSAAEFRSALQDAKTPSQNSRHSARTTDRSLSLPAPEQMNTAARDEIETERPGYGAKLARLPVIRSTLSILRALQAGIVVEQRTLVSVALGLGVVSVMVVVAVLIPRWLFPRFAVRAPELVGQHAESARVTAREAGLSILTQEEWSESASRGTVLQQDPPPNTAMQSDQPLKIVVSGGPSPVRVPILAQRRLDDARSDLIALGLALGKVEERESRQGPWGVIERQSAKPGTELPRGSAVDVIMAAPPWTSAADLTDLAIGEAEARLEREGLRLGAVRLEAGGGKRAGTVVRQEPAPGARMRHGESVSVTIVVPSESAPAVRP